MLIQTNLMCWGQKRNFPHKLFLYHFYRQKAYFFEKGELHCKPFWFELDHSMERYEYTSWQKAMWLKCEHSKKYLDWDLCYANSKTKNPTDVLPVKYRILRRVSIRHGTMHRRTVLGPQMMYLHKKTTLSWVNKALSGTRSGSARERLSGGIWYFTTGGCARGRTQICQEGGGMKIWFQWAGVF